MKRIFPAFALCATLAAQQAPPDLRYTDPMSWDADWAGVPDRVYFPQWSPDLENWVYLPTMRFGEALHGMAGTISEEKGFVRLAYYDDGTLADLEAAKLADHDTDGLANFTEISATFTDPFSDDTDSDSITDGWEIANGLDPNDDGSTNPANGGSGDPDHDGLNNWEEQSLATNPNDADSDGDGITDGGEAGQGSDPNDPTDTPEAEWFVLTGDLGENTEKSRSRTVTIPAGQSRLVLIALHTEEYPLWTTDQSHYNDTLHWSVTADGETPITGTLDVNSRHDEFDLALIEGTEFQNFYPSHAEKIESFTAPPGADLEVVIELSATNIGDDTLPSTVMVGLLPVEVLEAETEAGFDDFPRLDSSETPAHPWVMAPSSDLDKNRFVLAGFGENKLALNGTVPAVQLTPEQTGQEDPLTVSVSGTLSGDGEGVELEGSARLVNLAYYPKMTVNVKFFEVTLIRADGEKVTSPGRSKRTGTILRNYLNRVYGKQCNVFFNIADDNTEIEVAYDVGDPDERFAEYSRWPSGALRLRSPGNDSFDCVLSLEGSNMNTTEEELVRAAGFDADAVANIYLGQLGIVWVSGPNGGNFTTGCGHGYLQPVCF